MKLQDCHDGGAGGGDVADDGEDHLDHCRSLLSALSDSIPSACCLLGRWSAVSATVSRLSAALSAGAASHPLAGDLLRSLPPALSAALVLSRRCASPDPPAGGKLRTQSDLSAAAALLSSLAADADLLLHSPTSSDNTTTIRSLITRLQIGTFAARAAALDALVASDDKTAVTAAAQGVVPALLRLLDTPETKTKAVAAVARIAAVGSCRAALAAEGPLLLSHLARVLDADDGSSPATEAACAALLALTLARDSAMAVGTRGGVAALAGICRAGTPPARAAAARVLANLALIPELHHYFLEDSAIPTLVGVLSSGTVAAQENALSCLHNLTTNEEGHELKHSILTNGGINCVRNYWAAGGGRNIKPAIGLLRNLTSNKYIAETILSAGFLPLVTAALASSASGTRAEAARLIAKLASTGKASKEFGELECVLRLVGMLDAKAGEEQEAAVKALASLMPCARSRRRFREEEKGIWDVVHLLDPLNRSVEKKYPVAVLQSVSQSKKCRKQMVAAGAGGYLQKLVEMEVEGAKKLLEVLGRGKLWGVLTRT